MAAMEFVVGGLAVLVVCVCVCVACGAEQRSGEPNFLRVFLKFELHNEF